MMKGFRVALVGSGPLFPLDVIDDALRHLYKNRAGFEVFRVTCDDSYLAELIVGVNVGGMEVLGCNFQIILSNSPNAHEISERVADIQAEIDRRWPATTEPEGRLETCVVQEGDDWPGVFIRGDHAAYYALQLTQVLSLLPEHKVAQQVAKSILTTLRDLFASSNVHAPGHPSPVKIRKD